MYGIENEIVYEIMKSRELSAAIREYGEWREVNWPEPYRTEGQVIQEKRLANLQELVKASISVALSGVVSEHDLDVDAKNGAYPDLNLDDSISQVCDSLAYDVIDLFTIPALDIVSEIAEWIRELNDFHGASK